MILPLLLATAAQASPADPSVDRYARCVDLVRTDPAAALAEADRWQRAGGDGSARHCAGLAQARTNHWAEAGTAFADAARLAEAAKDSHAAAYWAQAGNAWLAAGEPVKARTALDAAMAAGTLDGLALGEVQLDHARALVAGDELAAARTDLDHALVNAKDDPLAWLLSATLARRMDDLPRAKRDIDQALLRASDDASVQLEAGNIAARMGNEAAARAGWTQAAQLAPDTDVGRHAAAALQQFDRPVASSGR